MTNNYIKVLRFLYLWDIGGSRMLSTCACSPFVACGCWSFKLHAQILPNITDTCRKWQFDFYFMRCWLSIYQRVLHRNGNRYSHRKFGYASKRVINIRRSKQQ